MNTHKSNRNIPCTKGDNADTTVCEKREKSFTKPIIYWLLHVLLPLPVVSLFELEWNPLNWSIYTHLIGAIWVLYATKKLYDVIGR